LVFTDANAIVLTLILFSINSNASILENISIPALVIAYGALLSCGKTTCSELKFIIFPLLDFLIKV